MDEDLKKQIESYNKVRAKEITEATKWIKNGEKDADWHWEDKEKQPDSLEGSFEYFLAKYPNKEDHKEDNIIHFCGQEIYDLWNDYEDDKLSSRQNHCAALYVYIKEKISNK